MDRNWTVASRLIAIPVGIGLLAAGPFAVAIGLVFLEHLSPWHSQVAELLFILAGVATGVAGIWLLPVGRPLRPLQVLSVITYAVVMAATTWFSLLPFVCGFFGDCL